MTQYPTYGESVDEIAALRKLVAELQAQLAQAVAGERKWRETVNTYVITKNPDLEYGAFKEICAMLGLDAMAQSRYQEEEDDYENVVRARDSAIRYSGSLLTRVDVLEKMLRSYVDVYNDRSFIMPPPPVWAQKFRAVLDAPKPVPETAVETKSLPPE